MINKSIITVVATLIPMAALSCPPLSLGQRLHDPAVRTNPDCSFRESGSLNARLLTGGKIVDLGDGLVAQAWADSAGCAIKESLFIADCNSSETVEIKGVPDPDAPVEVLGGEMVTQVQNLYAPVGALNLNRITSLSEAIEVSKSAGYQYSTNAAEEMKAMAKRNRVDLMCGCKLHYPYSRGAAS